MIGEILKKSLTISWQNFGLWFLGFLTSLFFFLTNPLFLLFFLTEVLIGDVFLSSTNPQVVFKKPLTAFNLNTPLTILILAIFIFLLALCIFSEIFLIFSLSKIGKGEKFNFKKSWQRAKNNFLPTSIVCLVGFLMFILFLFGIHFLILSVQVWVFFLIIFFFFLISLVSALLIFYIIFYFVVKRNSLRQAFYSFFLFLKNSWLKVLSLMIILFLFMFGFGLLWWLVFDSGALFFPLKLGSIFLIKFLGWPGFWFSWFFFAFLILVFQITTLGFLNVYQTSCWVFLFLERGKEGEESVDKENKKTGK
ncbi:MAG: hypothetical protein N2259_03090 [Patescibacteria group bacterium]|nr:hypothetical protein [Patescibacteria group bacterium]